MVEGFGLGGWADGAGRLLDAMGRGVGDDLAGAFLLSAAVLRHLLADPRLPVELLPDDWPGAALRRDYERFEGEFKRALRAQGSTTTGSPVVTVPGSTTQA